MPDAAPATTFLFTDIEGSTRLWERAPERMRDALAGHDRLLRETVAAHAGRIVKMTGDGAHAAFADPLQAVAAALALQRALADPAVTGGLPLAVRCGMHGGVDEERDGDYFGPAVNRAARVMSAAHGGQVLLSQFVATRVRERLDAPVALRDLGTVRLRDLSAPERVFQLVDPALRADFPPLRSLEATPNNLPQQATSFVGRERDLAAVKALFATTRLLTLHGVGGIGKTRLSLQVAADLMDDHPDGVWFVELAAINDGALVPQTVASVLGVKEEAGRPVEEALVRALRDRRLLLILDNCEHVIEACARLATLLLRECGELRLLTSSRERLNIRGETTYPVPALSLPEGDGAISVAALSGCEAGRLFLERASAVQPAFAAQLKDANAVTEICRRLDGIPLAIELAAARVRAFTVDQIAARLSDRFRLLAQGDRAALPRQQTLRALIDWSHDLLTPVERRLFAALAVFAGGWPIEAAEAVGSAAGIDAPEVVDVLALLVDKSLVAQDLETGRYRMLDTVRHYALERLAACDVADAIQRAHFAFFRALAEAARPQLLGPSQGEWLARLDLERENLLAAHAWCATSPRDADGGLSLAISLKVYWINRGLLGLGERVTVEALARTRPDDASRLRGRGFFNAGQFCCFMGRYREARVHLRESLAIARRQDDRGTVEAVLQLLGLAALGEGDPATARGHLDEALSLARELGNPRKLAAAVNARAQLHRVEGELDRALPLYEQFMTLAADVGDRELIAIGLLNLAMVAIHRGEGDTARRRLEDALAIAQDIGSKPAGQSVVEVTAGLAASRGCWTDAAYLYGAAEAQTAATGLSRDPADEAFLAPLIETTRAALDARGFADAAARGRGLEFEAATEAARAFLERTR